MATWPANGDTDWNTKMLAYLAIGHETNGTHGTKSGFQDRGDPSSADFEVGDLTTDATWKDLDLSSIIPVSTKAVLLRCTVDDGSTGMFMQFRENGNSNAKNSAVVRTQAANVSNDGDLIVTVDSDRIIEYNGSNTTFTSIEIIVKGWWI